MAGRYSRTYTRKKSAAAPPPISQFDRLVTEHGKSTHPVASKTAGHVGKWGVTSFTSLRSITETYGKEEPGKRTWLDSPPSTAADPVTTEAAVPDASKVTVPPKRRKFFKSRDYNSVSNSVSSSQGEEISSDAQSFSLSQNQGEEFNLQKFPQSVNSGSYKNVESSSQVKSQKASTVIPPLHKAGGGIKLKIFKSRNSDTSTCETYSSTVQLPSDDSGSSSNSSSIANSPKPDSTLQTDVSVQSPNGVTLPDPHPSKCDLDPIESLKENLQTDNLAITDFKSISKYGMSEEKLLTQAPDFTPQSEPESAVPLTEQTDQSKDTARKKQEPDSEPKNSSDLSTSESSRTNSSKNECENFGFVDNLEMEEQSLIQEESVKGDVEREMDLFSTDFDENEIVDRTCIEYPGSSSSNFSEVPLIRANTIDLDDLEPSHPQPASNLSSRTRSNTKSLSQTDFDSSKATIGTKKRSIFKSRQKEGESKKRATYKHKWHGHEEKDDNFKKDDLPKSASVSEKPNEDPFAFDTTPVLNRVQTWPTSNQCLDNSFEEEPVTSVKCPKQAKKYYTVIKNVKKTHQLQESGEFQEFNDDVDYFLDALRSSNSVSTRCLASLNLAQKCMTPAFRMHLRAHATVTKFFRALSDAPSHPQLAECAAMVMFALSQDRLNMDLDKSSLELMLNLLDTDSSSSENMNILPDAAAVDNTNKIRSLCTELQLKGHAKHLKLDKINSATLAMETLLSLTSKRAGEWFKEELRELGGVDHLTRTVTSYCNLFSADFQCWTSYLLDKLSKIDRCLKVLENVTHQNEVNQEYLLNMNGGQFSNTLMRLFSMCHSEVPLNPMKSDDPLTLSSYNPEASKGIIPTLITTIKVLINLTHGTRKEALGSVLLGKDEKIYNITVYCLLMMPLYLDHDTKFEIQVLACCLLLNLVENSAENRLRLMNLPSPVAEDNSDDIFDRQERETAMSSLVALFYTSEESARIQEAHTDQIIDKDLVPDAAKEEEKKDEDIEETVARLLQKAGRHMEDTLIAAYTALLAGYCLMDNKEYEEKIRYLQPEGHFKTMVAVLKKFLHFMNLTATVSNYFEYFFFSDWLHNI
ncbi:UNVERIFIED_CONTAM: hypothetical protein GTU68_005604, partial [Idotea baltica]|nr:hypothetical protein [Idotea baltica]